MKQIDGSFILSNMIVLCLSTECEMDAKKMTKVMKKNKEIKGKKNKYKRNLRNRILLVKNKVDAFQEKKILFS